MPDQVDKNQLTWQPLEHSCIVYRIGPKPFHIDANGNLVRAAFLRKGPNSQGYAGDVLGLSVSLNCKVDDVVTDWQKIRPKEPSAVGKLIVGSIRKIQSVPSLDVVQNKPTHANIVGLPACGEDVARAEKLASELAKICECVYFKGNS